MAKLDDLSVTISGTAAPLVTATEQAKRAIDGLERAAKGLDRSLSAPFTKLGSAARSAMQGIASAVRPVTIAAGAAAIAVGGILKQVQATAKETVALAAAAASVGLTTEQFTRLKFAVDSVGVSQETLTSAMRILSQRATEFGTAMSEGSLLLRGLGVAVQDAGGHMLGLDQIMLNVADSFAQMQDGTEKTRLAIRLFGEQGAKLLPILNQGSAGIRQMMAESDAFGSTLTTRTSAAIVAVNADLTRIRGGFDALVREITVRVAPAIKWIAELFDRNSLAARVASGAFDGVGYAWQGLVASGSLLKAALLDVWGVLAGVSEALRRLAARDFNGALDAARAGLAGFGEQLKATGAAISAEIDKARAGLSATGAEADIVGKAFPMTLAPVIATTQQASAAAAALKQSYADFATQIASTNTAPFEERFMQLRNLVQGGAIDLKVFGQAWQNVVQQQAAATDQLLSTTSQALTTIFQKSKAAAIASALINTYQGITKAIASYPPPYSYAMAGLQAAMGFAQVRAIQSTSQSGSGGGGGASRGGGGGAGAGGGGAGGAGVARPQLDQTLTVEGFSASTFFSAPAVKELAKKLLDYQRDGGRVVLA